MTFPNTDAGILLWITSPSSVPASIATMPAPTIGRSAMSRRPRMRLITRTTILFTQRNAWMVARYSFLLLVARQEVESSCGTAGGEEPVADAADDAQDRTGYRIGRYVDLVREYKEEDRDSHEHDTQ